MPRARALLMSLLLTFLFCTQTEAQERLKINTSIKPPFSTAALDGYFDLLTIELFARNDIAVELVRLPPERALRYANDGLSDGEIPRIGGLSSVYANIVQVPEKVIDYHFVAFSQPYPLPEMTFDRLKRYRVGVLIGWKIYENNIPEGTEKTRLTGPLQMFLMLKNNRIDVGLYERYAGKYLIRVNGFDSIFECQPPLAVKPMFLYLNKKHASLVPTLADTLRAMDADGTREAIRSRTLESFEPRAHSGRQ